MMRVRTSAGLVLVAVACMQPLAAQTSGAEKPGCDNPNEVFACQGDAVLTQTSVDGAFSRIPEKDRLMFIRDGAKVDMMVRSLLQAEVVALDADKAGFAVQPEVQQRMMLAARKELAEAWLQELVLRAPEVDYAAMAQEDYILNSESYRKAATVDVAHILINTKSRSPEEALALASQLKSELDANPIRFEALVEEYSDDPSKASNSGQFKNVKRGQMVKEFEAAAFGMETVGELSEPVLSEFGYHIIRLDGKGGGDLPPYADVQDEAVKRMKAKYLEMYRTNYLQNLLKDPVVLPAGSVEIMARRYFGDDLENAPIFTEEGPK